MPGPLMFSSFLIQYGVVSSPCVSRLSAQRIQTPRVESPDREAQQTDPPERERVQHGPLEIHAMFLKFRNQPGLHAGRCIAHTRVVRPQVEPLHENRHNHPVDKDQRQRAAHGFKRAPQQQAPLAARAVLHHQHGQTANAKSPGDQRAQRPCAKKMLPSQVLRIQRLTQQRQNLRRSRRRSRPQSVHGSSSRPQTRVRPGPLGAAWRAKLRRVPFRSSYFWAAGAGLPGGIEIFGSAG